MRWLELSVETDVEAVEAVSEILGRVSAGTAVHPTSLSRDPADELSATPDPSAPFVVTAHVADGPDAAAQVAATERALWHLQAFGLRPMGELRVRAVEDSDWTERWKEHVSVQRIGRILIVPSWVAHDPAPGEVAISLDPGMAFGTGLHPTTRGCLRLLQELEPMPQRLLDVGCGSGILALAALRLGAAAAVGLDTEPEAVAATRANAERNGLGDRIDVRLGTLPATAERTFPLVLANLVAAVLIDLGPRLASHLSADGRLIASGIIEPRADEVVRAMDAAGLAVERRVADEDWVSLVLTRRAG